MIPVNLSLRNFLSHEATDIDFSLLSAACIQGSNGAGKCLAHTTMIHDAISGRVATIGDWYKRFQAGETFTVWGMSDDFVLSPVRVTNVFPSGRKKVLRVWLENNRFEDVSETHPVYTATGILQASRLVVGQHVAVPRHLRATTPHSPMTDDEVIVLAALLAEGSLTKQCYGFTNCEPKIVEFVNTALKSMGLTLVSYGKRHGLQWNLKSLVPHTHKSDLRRALLVEIINICDAAGVELPVGGTNISKVRALLRAPGYDNLLKLGEQLGNTRVFTIADALYPHEALRRLYVEYGVHNVKAKHKTLPAFVYEFSDEQVCKFLAIFWACDGYVSKLRKRGKAELSICLASLSLIEGLRRLLLRLGIQTSMRYRRIEGKYDAWALTPVGRASYERLCDVLIDMPHPKKRARIEALREYYSGCAINDNYDTVPPEMLFPLLRAAKLKTGRALTNKTKGLFYSEKQLTSHARSRDKVMLYAEHFNCVRLRALANSDIAWWRVKRIEPIGDMDTYDISVDTPNHLYALAGFITHNSSIMDSILYGLYGETSRGRDEGLVTMGQTEMSVVFDFMQSEKLYRTVRKKNIVGRGKSSVEFFAKGNAEPPFEWETIATGEAAKDMIVSVLGRDYDTFTSSSFLLQDGGGRFINTTPSERYKIVFGILGLEVYQDYKKSVASFRNKAEAKGEVISQSSRDLEAKAGRLSHLKEKLVEIEGALSLLKTELQTKEAALAEKSAQAAVLESKAKDASALEQKAEGIRKNLKGIEDSIAKHKKVLDNKDRILSLVEEEKTARETVVTLRAKADVLLKEIEALNISLFQISAKEKEIARLQAAVASREKEREMTIKSLSEKIASAKKNAALLDKTPCKGEGDFGSCALIKSAVEGRDSIPSLEEELVKASVPFVSDETGKIAAIKAEIALSDKNSLNESLKSKSAEVLSLRNETAKIEKRLEVISTWTKQASGIAVAEASLKSAEERIAQLKGEMVQAEKDSALLKESSLLLAAIRSEVDTLKYSVMSLKQKEMSSVGEMSRINAELKESEAASLKLKEVSAELEQIARSVRVCTILEEAYEKIPMYIFDNLIPIMEDEANRVLSEISTTGMRVEFKTEKITKTTKAIKDTLDIVVSDLAGERRIEYYSGGEKTRLVLALTVALAELGARKAGTKIDTLAIDEPAGLDEQGLIDFGKCFIKLVESNIFKKGFLVAHAELLKDVFDQKILVEKEGAVSKVTVMV